MQTPLSPHPSPLPFAGFGFVMRCAIVAGLSIVILVALLSIRGVAADRQQNRMNAVHSIAASHAGAQRIAGPVLVVPYEETERVRTTDEEGRTRTSERRRSGQWTFFPDSLDMAGTLVPATRKLGLHEVRVYELQARMDAAFNVELPAEEAGAERTVGEPWLAYGFADVRGLAGAPKLLV